MTPEPTFMDLHVQMMLLDPRVQQRVALDDEKVEEYADLYRDGRDLGRLVVFWDRYTYILADGFHRAHAAAKIGREMLPVEVYETTINECLRAAILYATGCNLHGKPLSNQDKRKRVTTLLEDPEWSRWSDGAIARHCGVTQPFVSKLRASLITVMNEKRDEATGQPTTRQYTTKHGTVATMHTGGIGRNGVVRCSDCGRPLSDPASISRGSGPICACKTPAAPGHPSAGPHEAPSGIDEQALIDPAEAARQAAEKQAERQAHECRMLVRYLGEMVHAYGFATVKADIWDVVCAQWAHAAEPAPDDALPPVEGSAPAGRSVTYGELPPRVAAALQAHGKKGATASTLATEVEAPRTQVWASLERLVKQGKAVKRGTTYIAKKGEV